MTCKRTYKKKRTTKKKRTHRKGSFKILKVRRVTRKGKISPWVKAGIAAVTPSVLATGYGLIKHLSRNKYAGYSNIYA